MRDTALRAAGRRRRHLLAALAVLGLAVAIPSSGLAVANIPEVNGHGPGDFDARTGHTAPTSAQKALVRKLGATATWNRFGTPQTLMRPNGYLASGVRGRNAAGAARAWLNANRALFRLRSVANLRTGATTPLGKLGRAVTFRQRIGGVTLLPEGLVTVALRGSRVGWRIVSVSSSLVGDTALKGSARLSPRAAVYRAAVDVGNASTLADVHAVRAATGWHVLRLDGIASPQRARLIGVPLPRGGVVPAYQTIVTAIAPGLTEAWEHLVDARNGRILSRHGLVDNLADNPRWKTFPAYPKIGGNRYPWNYPSADIRELWCWNPGPACDRAVSEGSPHVFAPWDTQGAGPGTMVPTFTTDGNNNRAAESWDGGPPGQHFLPGPTQYMPTSPTRDYVYPWTNVWFETLCDPANYTGPAAGKNDIEAAATNLFVMHNRMHDWSYHLGFDEQRWNGQDVNFGLPPAYHAPGPPTAPGDGLIGDVQEGARLGGAPNGYAARDNANMLTQPDGMSSITNMYLWQPLAGAFYAPCVDGDFDAAVIGHEFGHMIENRMIGKGVRRQGHHAGAMGESFGDLNGMEYLNEYGFVPNSGENPYSVGAYVTSNKYRAIRNYGMNFRYSGGIPEPGRYPFVNALNFSDIGYDIVGRQVHADGEIWSATNFDIRQILLAKYPGGHGRQEECANGDRPPEQCPGNRRWIQLYYDAMVLMPVAPSMIDARNSILAADLARFGGANQRELWYVFATRGFGASAFAANGEDVQPKPAFDSPLQGEETVRFRAFARDEGNAPIVANVYAGHYEARVSPIADTNPATGPADGSVAVDASNLDNVASFAPRTYELVANAPGYGHLRFRATFRAGKSRTIDLYFATNWASRNKGAVATGDGTRLPDLIDDTEITNWHSGGAPVEGRRVTVQLGGGAHKLRRSQVSAYLTLENQPSEIPPPPPAPGTQNRFTALRAFELRACLAGSSAANPSCAGTTDAGWQVVYRSSPDFFPGDTPRPVAPELLLRGFDLSGNGGWHHDRDDHGGLRGGRATHVQLVVLSNQCTGNPAFQGEQDRDPANTTDCRIGNLAAGLPPRGNDVRAAELQVYSSKHRVHGAKLVESNGGGKHHDDD
ncbi:MAG: M36 family metallopeptidase [Gaiellaceae bacterium]